MGERCEISDSRTALGLIVDAASGAGCPEMVRELLDCAEWVAEFSQSSGCPFMQMAWDNGMQVTSDHGRTTIMFPDAEAVTVEQLRGAVGQ